MKYFIIAGEKSGDMHAANLCEEIFRNDARAEIIGWGGENMEAKGVKVLKNYRELARCYLSLKRLKCFEDGVIKWYLM